MTWKENLTSNVLVVGILLVLAIIIYCRVKNKTITEFIIEMREAFSTPIQNE